MDYPKLLAESQGGVIGDYLLLTGGFDYSFSETTTDTYKLDLTDPDAAWQKQDSYPLADGITHGAAVVIGDKFYICGGYLGGHPGPHIPNCFVFDNTVEPGTIGQWSALPDMPDGRGGGGLVHDSTLNALTYAGGAERPNADQWFYFSAVYTVDYQNTWTLDLDNLEAGWKVEPDIPYLGNHMSYVTAFDENSNEHHYYFGGQLGDLEYRHNLDSNYEWDAVDKVWTERARTPFPRGHAAESSRPVSCGFIQAGGSLNGAGITTNIQYYDIKTDSWIKIGDLPVAVQSPVCDRKGDYLYCLSGLPGTKFFFSARTQSELFSVRRKLIVP